MELPFVSYEGFKHSLILTLSFPLSRHDHQPFYLLLSMLSHLSSILDFFFSYSYTTHISCAFLSPPHLNSFSFTYSFIIPLNKHFRDIFPRASIFHILFFFSFSSVNFFRFRFFLFWCFKCRSYSSVHLLDSFPEELIPSILLVSCLVYFLFLFEIFPLSQTVFLVCNFNTCFPVCCHAFLSSCDLSLSILFLLSA